MKNKIFRGRLLYLLLSTLIVVLTGFKLASNKRTATGRLYIYDRELPVSVQVMQLVSSEASDTYTFAGIFEPVLETRLTASLQGTIAEVFVSEGDFVRKNDVLARLDNSILKIQLKEAELNIEELKRDVKRYKVLAEAEAIQGIQLEKTELGLKKALLNKEILENKIDNTYIRAPFDGHITAKMNEKGGFAAPGVPLFQLTDISVLTFKIFVPESSLSLFTTAPEYIVTADALPGIRLQGELNYAGSKANPGNSFPVQFRVLNTTGMEIKAGMSGKITFSVKGTAPIISIPASSVTTTKDGPAIYLVEGGRARLKSINISHFSGGKAMVSKGLQPGDVLITKGFINLSDGANVTVL